MSYVVDTCIVNKLVDGLISFAELPSDGQFYATHVQIDEINRTKNPQRRALLSSKFEEMGHTVIPTGTFVLDESRLDQACPGEGEVFLKLKHALDSLNNFKSNNVRDALIGETSILRDFTLLTADRDFAEVVKRNGGRALHIET